MAGAAAILALQAGEPRPARPVDRTAARGGGVEAPEGRDRRRCHRRDLVRAHRDRAPQPHRAGLDRGANHAVADRLTSARQRQPAGTRQRKGLRPPFPHPDQRAPRIPSTSPWCTEQMTSGLVVAESRIRAGAQAHLVAGPDLRAEAEVGEHPQDGMPRARRRGRPPGAGRRLMSSSPHRPPTSRPARRHPGGGPNGSRRPRQHPVVAPDAGPGGLDREHRAGGDGRGIPMRGTPRPDGDSVATSTSPIPPAEP